MQESDDKVLCPLIDDMLEIGECVVNSDIAAGMFKERNLPDKFKQKGDWREICRKCQYHDM